MWEGREAVCIENPWLTGTLPSLGSQLRGEAQIRRVWAMELGFLGLSEKVGKG